MSIDNAYTELGLASGADEIAVKMAWRKLVSQWHPDRNSNASAGAKMQRINQAFEQIRGSGFIDAPEAAPAPDTSAADANPPADAWQGRVISRKVKLTLEEAALGCTRLLRGRFTDPCASCGGAGFHAPRGTCLACEGAGTVRERTWYGWRGTPADCEACGGSGLARQPCEPCAGSGKLGACPYTVTVRIPQGVRSGDLLHVGARRPRPGQTAVALDLRVEVVKHAFFDLGDDGSIRCQIPVDGFAWIANRWIEVPTVGGLQRLRLSRDQLSYRLAGQGFPVARRGARGDQWVQVVPGFPERLSTDQEILFDQLVATVSGAAGDAADTALGSWNRSLRAWQRDLAKGKA